MQAGCKNQLNTRLDKKMNTTYEHSLFRPNEMAYEEMSVLDILILTILPFQRSQLNRIETLMTKETNQDNPNILLYNETNLKGKSDCRFRSSNLYCIDLNSLVTNCLIKMNIEMNPLEKLLQEVMSRSSNFIVPDESKLVGVTNYKQWAVMMIAQLKQFYCDLEMVLDGRFEEIPEVGVLTSRDQARIFSVYNTIIGNLMRNALEVISLRGSFQYSFLIKQFVTNVFRSIQYKLLNLISPI